MSKKLKNLDRHVKIKVVGVGGAGTNAVDRLVLEGFQDVTILSINTDTQHLLGSIAPEKIQIGAQRTRGLGAGGNPQVGEEAALEDEMELRSALTGYDLVFLAAGMGGGTGTGAGPVIARIAREQGALVLSLVTLPFSSEGKHRCRVAKDGLKTMGESADAVICIPNDRLLSLASDETSVLDAFRPTDQFLCEGVKLIYSMLAKTGLINIDFADLSAVLRREQAQTLVGYGVGCGEKKVDDAVRAALKSPLLSQTEILKQASAALVCMTYGPATTMREVNHGMQILQDSLGDETAIKVGYVIDEAVRDEVSVLVIASTGRVAKSKAATKIKKAEAPAPESEVVEQPEAEAEFQTEPENRLAEFEPPAVEISDGPGEGELDVEPAVAAVAAKQMTEVFVTQSSGKTTARRTKAEPKQESLPLEASSHGIFDKHERTIVNGQDLDQPTYLRLGVRLQRVYR